MKRTTEADSNYNDLEKKSVAELLHGINKEDTTVPYAVEKVIPAIEKVVTVIVEKISKGGRLFYIGAGTSGRLGVLDASECPPTYGVPFDMVIGIIAGGDKAIRGKKGTPVEILVKRDTLKKNFSVLRERIVVSSIDAAYMLNEQSGYIKISKFGAATDEDFLEQLQKLQKQMMKNLVLDLRDNGGGYLSAATGLADEFLKDKELIVYTEGLHEPRTDYFASSKGNFEQGKLVVLIDENTASASEIVAGAIQDLERGTIIGRRSFGKGLVQEQFDFGDGSALNLTIARYYTASGRSIQKSYKKGNDAYYGEVGERYKNGELASDGRNLSDTLFDKKKTFTTKSGKVLYGGGGIMPDIYVPVDTSGYTSVYYSLTGKGVLNDMVFNHLIKSNPKFNSSEEIVKNFKLSEQDVKKIVQLAAIKNIKTTEKQVELSRKEIETQIKALFARYYFGDEGYYKALNSGDQAIARSLEVLK